MNTQQRKDWLSRFASDTPAYDLVVVGGGITGAGIAAEAAGSGLKVLLIEQQDFAWGTSSRSSKMVHGGLRYLGSGQLGLTRDAVNERQRLMAELPGLIEPLQFIMPHYRRQFPGPRLFGMLLRAYDRIAGVRSRRRLTPADTLNWVPGLNPQSLVAASGFTDAVTDDARLVLRVIDEARHAGAHCLNYVRAEQVLRDQDGRVTGLTVRDNSADNKDASVLTISAPLVISATGAWAGELQRNDGPPMRIRPLRGSHLVVPWSRLPVTCSVSLLHPQDRRPVFAFPWQGATVLGTTDLDHETPLTEEPGISQAEVDYLLRIVDELFPGRAIEEADILSTWAGVRPVVSRNEGKSASQENREHAIWDQQGLVTVAGGKLTTFRLIARETLQHGKNYLPSVQWRPASVPLFRPAPTLARPHHIGHQTWLRLTGSYGPALARVLDAGATTHIADTDTLWCELTWAAAQADVVHLDDLLLRRSRLGQILPDGAQAWLPAIREHCAGALGWDYDTWNTEVQRYLALWRNAYALPAQRSQTP
ncbi:glycerol-3-phosphate dehydrogenase/oxidase [Marinobacter xestospongiae]|uniref:Glycerol-3-phosphate dehydrogenase/oxidase n=1 Tax=Marinobacter xestospongiae TaxID=994319 RepID=A0ABU3VXV9_9GAMM|nr:glycerol-3-phosphate dehydrogenase/oxidase [Marinobacter xestospongiae]MDV2079123.1 glycerol-3-phosphate dehydrogenase/oxidase [Marinobacter xestospongiae]